MENIMMDTKQRVYFNFRLINLPNGDQIIDQTLRTPTNALTAVQMTEYLEIENAIFFSERMARKMQKEAEEQRKKSRRLLYRLACLFGIL